MAVHFADLHDTPGRMKAKGVIRRQVNWAQSRAFFFWRLRRRLTEFDLAAYRLAGSGSGGSGSPAGSRQRREAVAELQAWFAASGGKPEVWDDDRRFILWLQEEKNKAGFNAFVAARKAALAGQALADRVAACDEDGLRQAVAAMPAEARARLLAALK